MDGVTVLEGRGPDRHDAPDGEGAAQARAGALHVRGEVPVARGRAGAAAALVGGRGVRPRAAAGVAARPPRGELAASVKADRDAAARADARRATRLRPLSRERIPGRDRPAAGAVAGGRGPALSKPWLMNWLADPAKVRADAHMPALFADDRAGFVERWIVADSLTAGAAKREDAPPGDHRRGPARVPQPRAARRVTSCPTSNERADEDSDSARSPASADRMSAARHRRVPRQPALPLPRRPHAATAGHARRGARHRGVPLALVEADRAARGRKPPTAKELQDAFRKLGARDQAAAAATLLRTRAVPRATPAWANRSRATCRSTDRTSEYGRVPRRRDRCDLFTRRRARRQSVHVPHGRREGEAPVAVRRAAAAARARRLRAVPPARHRPAAADRGDRQHARRGVPAGDCRSCGRRG